MEIASYYIEDYDGKREKKTYFLIWRRLYMTKEQGRFRESWKEIRQQNVIRLGRSTVQICSVIL